jgi:hypothetical protein
MAVTQKIRYLSYSFLFVETYNGNAFIVYIHVSLYSYMPLRGYCPCSNVFTALSTVAMTHREVRVNRSSDAEAGVKPESIISNDICQPTALELSFNGVTISKQRESPPHSS